MPPLTRLPLLGYGFRPFFLGAGVFAALVVPVWLLVLATGTTPLPGLPAALWHGHEMFFGFVVAAISGFLLTAIPSSTARRGFAGAPLLVLGGAWLAARVVFSLAALLPFALVAALELALLPLLAGLLAPPLLRERNRNLPMLAVLLALWIADAAFLAAFARADAGLAHRALLATLDVVLLLVTIVAGRVVPAVTASSLRRRDASFTTRSRRGLERALPLLMLAVLVADAWPSPAWLAAVLALVAAVLHAWRLAGWGSLQTGAVPILWVLHVAYAWLPLGFLLKAAALLSSAPWAAHWLHAFGIGVVATLILGVTTRTTLGHTGRALAAGPATAAAYGLLALAALFRVVASAWWPSQYFAMLLLAAGCWSAAWGIYLGVFGPMLLRPRADGRPG